MSTIVVTNISDGTTSVASAGIVEGALKVLWDYSQGGPTTNRSYNVSSITDVATSDFDLNLTNAFADTLYVGGHIGKDTDGGGWWNLGVGVDGSTMTTSVIPLASEEGGTSTDTDTCGVFYGDDA